MSRELFVNEEIRARDVRVVDDKGEQLGIMALRDALRAAAERNLDLVEVAPTARPPVCRIMDFGRYKYEQSKRDREARKRQHIVSIKEVRMTPKIEDHDYDVKVKNAEKFLREGDKVKVSVRFRGREIVHTDIAQRLLREMAATLSEVCIMEREPRVEGRHMIMILTPRQE
ncbi:MAG TPA: translation initiation factor IF-3 [Firmicutes bacterium]|nr:translation initiation factor IF-3 [Bacillota bacterium]HBK59367.1 translation initiation factor IF-3 [Bacillota bacterium]